jgi:hypothetical protein
MAVPSDNSRRHGRNTPRINPGPDEGLILHDPGLGGEIEPNRANSRA